MSMSSLEAESAINVVVVAACVTLRAKPNESIVAVATDKLNRSPSIVNPVTIAISWSKALALSSPNPGAFMVVMFRTPLSLLTTNVANASPTTSSAMSKTGGDPASLICSKVAPNPSLAQFFRP